MAPKALSVAQLAAQAIPRHASLASKSRSTWHPLPFLLPIIHRRNINTTTPIVDSEALPDGLLTTPPQQRILAEPMQVKETQSTLSSTNLQSRDAPRPKRPLRTKPVHDSASPRYDPIRTPPAPLWAKKALLTTSQNASPSNSRLSQSLTESQSSSTAPAETASQNTPLTLSPSLTANLPHLTAQGPHYITIHIHGRPYLVTAGDTLRLPFLMHGVMPGDILRLDKASVLGSRDWTLKPTTASAMPTSAAGKSVTEATLAPAQPEDTMLDPSLIPTSSAEPLITGNTTNLPPPTYGTGAGAHAGLPPPRPRQRFLDDRLFVCRAVVMGTESEPMRVKEKTKRRQRKIKKVKSKHRFTVLKIREVRVRDVGELGRLFGKD